MQPTDYTISPSEIEGLKEYIEALKEPSYYSEELRNADVSRHHFDVARRLIQFHTKLKEESRLPVIYNGNPINLKFLASSGEQDYNIKVLLHDYAGLIVYLTEMYTKSLEENPRHHTLSKTITEMTGYDLQKLVMYLLEDIQAKQQKGEGS